MKKFLKILGITVLSILLILYLAFLFILPRAIDLNQYKPMLQDIIKTQAKLDFDFENVKLVTTPLLGTGVQVNMPKIKYEDDEELLRADKLKARISLPSLLLFTIKVSCLEIENPYVNLTIPDGKNLKILQHVDKLLTEQEKNIGQTVSSTEPSIFDVSKIKIIVPAAKLLNYKIKADDVKNGHNLVLNGDEFVLGYFNGKTLRVKTNSALLSDNETKITANIDVNTFLPAPTKLDAEDDRMQRAELPYANIVELYRTYDLKTDINAKLKIREKEGKYKLWGFVDVDNLTLKFSDYALPKSYAHLKFRDEKIFADTDFSVDKDQNIKLLGFIKHGNRPNLDLIIDTDKIYFQSLVDFTKAILDTFEIKNNLAWINTSGYIEAKAKIKTNFKKLKSSGEILVRDESFYDKKTGLKIKDGNADINFYNDTLTVKNSKVVIDGTPLIFKGAINEKSVADINIKTEKLPLKGLFNTFAPTEIKKAYNFNSGNLSVDIDLAGELKKALLTFNASLDTLSISDAAKTFNIINDKAEVSFIFDRKNFEGWFMNNKFKFNMPQTNSFLENNDLRIDFNSNDIKLNPSNLKINDKSVVDYYADVHNWQNPKKTKVDFLAEGNLNAEDLKKFGGKDFAQFIDAKGEIPVMAALVGDAKRQNFVAQISADSKNYITPIHLQQLIGKQSLIQTKITFKGNHFKVKETGLFEKVSSVDPKTGNVVESLKEILGVEGTVVNHKTAPFINLLTVKIPENLTVDLQGFKKGDFTFGGKLYMFGEMASPRYKGGFYINDLNIDDLLLSIKTVGLGFTGKKLNVGVDELLLNGSDIDINSKINLEPSDTLRVDEFNLSSDNIDVDKMMTSIEKILAILPQGGNNSSSQADIPVRVETGNIDISYLKTGEIEVADIKGLLRLLNNVLYIDNLTANAFNGNVLGDISMNLLSNMLHIKMNGKNINADKLAVDAAGLKNTISGTLAFSTNLVMNAAAANFNEQLKSINGNVDFEISNGQLGPFGKLENMIVAENIRESSFFQTALGGIINNLTTIDTTHFNKMLGHIVLKNAIVNLSPITTTGNILNLYIIGDMDIIKNYLDIKVRAKLGSEISNMLGPIAALNPINLVKATPGLNVAMAKTFALFCEELSAEEFNAIPRFKDDNAEFYATKFQIVARGDLAKPLTLIKSFKWLVTPSEMDKAQEFVSSLPEPIVTEDGTVLQTEEEINAYLEYQNKKSTKVKNFFKHMFKKENKNKATETEKE